MHKINVELTIITEDDLIRKSRKKRPCAIDHYDIKNIRVLEEAEVLIYKDKVIKNPYN